MFKEGMRRFPFKRKNVHELEIEDIQRWIAGLT
jgi:hypothetical protein